MTPDLSKTLDEVRAARDKMLSGDQWSYLGIELIVHLRGEQDKLAELEQQVAAKKLEILGRQEKRNVAACEIELEATEVFAAKRKQELLIKIIEELNSHTKIQARSRNSY